MKAIKIYAPGSRVLLNEGVQPATINAAIIEHSKIQYEVVWWSEGTRYSETVDEWEIKSDSDKARKQRVDQIL